MVEAYSKEKIEKLTAEITELKTYRDLIATNGVCIKQQVGNFYQHPQDEVARKLLLRAFAIELSKKEEELRAEEERLRAICY